MENYFKLADDVELLGRWWLAEPFDALGKEINADSFTVGRVVEVIAPIEISLQYEGAPLDFTFGAFEMPVVNSRTLNLLNKLSPSTFESFSASIKGHGANYAVVNFLESRKCLDESRSEFIKWKGDDHRADKTGQYRQVTKLRINPEQAAACEIFRLWGWDSAIIVSERIKREFQRENITGVRFLAV